MELQKAFFDYFLKGIENDWRDTPPVRYEAREGFFKGEFKSATGWLLPGTEYTPLCLDGKGMALQNITVKEETKLSYNSEQLDNNELRFRITFKEDTELTGNMKLKLWVSTNDTDDMDLFIGIKKYDRRDNEVFFPDFNHIENGQVANGWLRVSHRELDTEKSIPCQPWLKHQRLLKLEKGEIVPVEIEILASGTFFKTGESLLLVIKGSEIITEGTSSHLKTRYEHTDTVNKGIHNIYVGGKYDSHLLVPVIPKKIF